MGKPLDGLCQHIDAPEAVFYRRDDKILQIFALDAFCRGHMSGCFRATAVERQSNADLFPVVARDFEAVGHHPVLERSTVTCPSCLRSPAALGWR